jgi:hypothetical protein
VIKFRCPNCTQKIAVNDEGADAVINCPTCVASIVIPRETAAEFRPAPPPALLAPRSAPVESVDDGAWSDRLEDAGLKPWLARMMTNRLMQALFLQRASLLDAQLAGTEQVTELERRLAIAQEQLEKRFLTYQQRITDLERQLASAREENRALRSVTIPPEESAADTLSDVLTRRAQENLRAAGLLLRT